VTQLETASFEVERFELAGNACLEVRGRWFGIRGRRFMRPALTAIADGREQRVLAVLDHKPWNAEEGETWLAAFPCTTDPAALAQAELTVAPDVTVPLPPPSAPPAGRRPKRGASRRSSPRQGDTQVKNGGPDRGPLNRRSDPDNRLRLEHDEALRSRNEAVTELEAVKRECEQLRDERRQALEVHEAAIAERHESIETEVRLRIEDLRAEAERERAGARLAAQTARERDEARAARDEAARERDEARAGRDEAQRARNRMLAERDTTRTRVEKVTRQWELAAGLGTRRTLERDALAVERDRLTRERDAALQDADRIARERDTALQDVDRIARERKAALQDADRIARERNAALQARDRAVHNRDAALGERDRIARERDTALEPREPEIDEPTLVLTERELLESQAPPVVAERTPLVPRVQPTRRRHAAVGTSSVAGAPGAQFGGPHDAARMWRMRLLAVSALLVAVVILVLLLLAK
jgi:hypothetical protein